ncbi:MAG: hypothetical protein MUC43_19030, partial [Pirellula sp.]|nr:hypothetical protein [Pirellula sp.]
ATRKSSDLWRGGVRACVAEVTRLWKVYQQYIQSLGEIGYGGRSSLLARLATGGETRLASETFATDHRIRFLHQHDSPLPSIENSPLLLTHFLTGRPTSLAIDPVDYLT